MNNTDNDQRVRLKKFTFLQRKSEFDLLSIDPKEVWQLAHISALFMQTGLNEKEAIQKASTLVDHVISHLEEEEKNWSNYFIEPPDDWNHSTLEDLKERLNVKKDETIRDYYFAATRDDKNANKMWKRALKGAAIFDPGTVIQMEYEKYIRSRAKGKKPNSDKTLSK